MSDSYSVTAVLSAYDKGFSAAMRQANQSTNALGKTVKSGLGFGVLSGIGQSAFNSITNAARGLISEMASSNATWKTFEGNMQMVGSSAKEIKKVKRELQDFAQKTIYSASDMAQTYSQLSAVGIKSCDKLVKGFGGLASAAENPKQAMRTLSQQATQMAAKPMVAWQDFKLMLEQTPAGIAQVAKSMGMTTSELVKNVQDGKIATDEFFDAISRVGTNKAFTDLATQYKTAGQAMDGLYETLSSKLSPAFEVLSQKATRGIEKIIAKIEKIDADKWAEKLSEGLKKAKPYWDMLVDTAKVLLSYLKPVGAVLKSVGGFMLEHADILSKLIPVLVGAGLGYKALSVMPNKLLGPFSSLGGAFNRTAASTKDSSDALDSLKNGLSTLAKGAGIALVVASLSLLVKAMGPIANAGANATANMASMGIVIAGLVAVFGTFGSALNAAIVPMLGLSLVIGAVGVALFGASALVKSFASLISSMGTAARNAGTGFNLVAQGINLLAGLSIGSIAKSLSAVALGLSAIGNSGKNLPTVASGMQRLVSALNAGVSKMTSFNSAARSMAPLLTSAGSAAGNGFANGISSGMNKAVSKTKSATKSINTALKGAKSGAYSSGQNIGIGLANGMASTIPRVRSVAAQLASAADRAIRLKAQIHSPSRVTDKLGGYFGQGFVKGIEGKISQAKEAARNLVNVPGVNSFAYAGGFSDDYSYGDSGSFTVEIPVVLDGKEVSRVVAPHMRKDLNQIDTREQRKRGKR